MAAGPKIKDDAVTPAKKRTTSILCALLNLIQIQKWSFGMWETSPPAAPLLLKEKFDKTLIPLLEKERLGEVLPDHTKLQFST